MKNIFKRTIAMMSAVITMAIMCCLTITTASAAEITPVNNVVSVSDTAAMSASFTPIAFSSLNKSAAISVPPYLKMQQQQPGGMTNTTADTAYKNVVEFIIKWLRRAGFLVGFFGGGMLLLSIKNEDADGKQRGILTMIAGFGLAALCIGASMFDLFT